MLLLVLVLLALAPGAARAQPSLLVVGDSLAIDSEPYLRVSLPDWRVDVRAWFGLDLRQGMRLIDGGPRPPQVVGFSLFTNDAPRDAPLLERTVTRTLRRYPGCHIWATPYQRTPRGNPFGDADRRLRALGRRHSDRLVIVDWARWAALIPALTGPDGVHQTTLGRWMRGFLYAGAARGCVRRLAREPTPQADAGRRAPSSPSSSRSSP
ncbi:MAG: hypothetical protein QOE65_1928 [Solirubrobacteraceae bacterium]|jgi:hypothetical protein|nr:hypothetical protein [Solirubrobacteraceae bacterium]